MGSNDCVQLCAPLTSLLLASREPCLLNLTPKIPKAAPLNSWNRIAGLDHLEVSVFGAEIRAGVLITLPVFAKDAHNYLDPKDPSFRTMEKCGDATQ